MKSSMLVVVRRYIAFLEVVHDGRVLKQVLRTAPEQVIKVVANYAINLLRGDTVHLSKREKTFFHKFKKGILAVLVGKRSVNLKRRALARISVRHPTFLPTLLHTVHNNIGDILLRGK